MIGTLLPMAARGAGTVNGSSTQFGRGAKAIGFFLNVTAAGTDAGDTLDVKIQHSPDEGTTWDDIVHFTQVLGNVANGVYQEMAFVNLEGTPEDELRAPVVNLAAANVIQGPIFPFIRAVSDIVDADADGGFTFSVTAQILK